MKKDPCFKLLAITLLAGVILAFASLTTTPPVSARAGKVVAGGGLVLHGKS